MIPEKLSEIENKIIEAGKIILNPAHTLEEVIVAGVDITNAFADIQYDLDVQYAAICTRAGCSDKPTAYIQRIYKSETAKEHRLKSIAKGYKGTLKNIEYNLYK